MARKGTGGGIATGGSPGGGMPPIINPGDIIVAKDPATWADGSAPNLFQAQAVWYVDSAIGLDTNDGLTALTPLLTLENLSLRLASAVLQQNTVINVKGSFANQALWLPRLAAGFTGTVLGTTTTVHSGTITALSNRVLGTSAPNFTDGAIVDVAPYVGKRIRITAGAANGRWAFIEFKMAATQAEVSQWNIDGTVGNASASTYVIEDLPVIGTVYQVNPETPDGFGVWQVRDCNVYKGYSNSSDVFLEFIGCLLGQAGQFSSFAGTGGVFLGCYVVASFFETEGDWYFGACGSASGAQIGTLLGNFRSDYGLYQEQLLIGPDCYAAFTTDNAVQRATIVDEQIQISQGAIGYLASGALWGTTAAAGVTFGLAVASGGRFVYGATTPTISGTGGAVVDIGGATVAYSALPLMVNGAMAVQNNQPTDVGGKRFYGNTVVPQSEASGSHIAT